MLRPKDVVVAIFSDGDIIIGRFGLTDLSATRRSLWSSNRGGGGGGGEDQGRRWHHRSPLQRRQFEEVGGGRVGRSEMPAEVTVVAVDACAEWAMPRGIPSATRLRGADCPGYTRYR